MVNRKNSELVAVTGGGDGGCNGGDELAVVAGSCFFLLLSCGVDVMLEKHNSKYARVPKREGCWG